MGVKLKQGFCTVGQYDMVIIAEGAEADVAAWMYQVGTLGNVRSTTLRAFNDSEMQQIVAKLS
jgi:uncharacterized protein with GYD domain